jgi:hypothetical protein
MAELVVESITPLITQALRNFRLRWVLSQGPS